MKQTYDIVIIGAGIVGSAIAYQLSKYECSVLVLEKEMSACSGQSGANSAIVHSGHDPIPNTLKAKFCIRGNELLADLSYKLGFRFQRIGGLLLANNEEEKLALDSALERALDNGVKVYNYNKHQILELEPNLNKNIIGGLYLPSTAVVFPFEVAACFLKQAAKYGVRIALNSKITAINSKNDEFILTINGTNDITARIVINSAGVFSEEITKLLLKDCEYSSVFRKGEYYVLDDSAKSHVSHVIYPIPSRVGKGVLLIPQVDGQLLIGPNNEVVSDNSDVSTSNSGLKEIKEKASKIINDIPFNKTIRTYAGIRSSLTQYDFYIENSKEYPNFYVLAGIDSPGLTSAPAIAEYLLKMIKKNYPLERRENYVYYKVANKLFRDMDDHEKEVSVNLDPMMGRIICKCEKVTAREIVNAYESIEGGNTLKGIKQITRAGAGTCQSGYCEEKIIKLLSEYYNIPMSEIRFSSKDNYILIGKDTK